MLAHGHRVLGRTGHQRGEVLTWWAYRALYVRSACQAVAEAMGTDLDELRDGTVGTTDPAPTTWTPLHDLLEADLADVADPADVGSDGPGGESGAALVAVRGEVAAGASAPSTSWAPPSRRRGRPELEQLLGAGAATDEAGGPAGVRLGHPGRARWPATTGSCSVCSPPGPTPSVPSWPRPAMGAMADGRFSPIDCSAGRRSLLLVAGGRRWSPSAQDHNPRPRSRPAR